MPVFRTIPSLLLIAAFMLAGAAPLCACLAMEEMQHGREPDSQHAGMPPCCMQQQKQQDESTPPIQPAQDQSPAPGMPDDCPHCQVRPTEAPRQDNLILPPPDRDPAALGLDIDFDRPLPTGLIQPSLIAGQRDHRATHPPALRADSLLARACLLTL